MKLTPEQKELLAEFIGDENVGVIAASLPVILWTVAKFRSYFVSKSELDRVSRERDEYKARCEKMEIAYRPLLEELSDLKNEQFLRDVGK